MEDKVRILEENGISVLEIKKRLKMIIVRRSDLEKASRLVNDEEVTVASRRA